MRQPVTFLAEMCRDVMYFAQAIRQPDGKKIMEAIVNNLTAKSVPAGTKNSAKSVPVGTKNYCFVELLRRNSIVLRCSKHKTIPNHPHHCEPFAPPKAWIRQIHPI